MAASNFQVFQAAPGGLALIGNKLRHFYTLHLAQRLSESDILGLKLGGEGDHREGFSHGETLFSVDKERIGLDFQVVFQSCLISE